MFLTKMKLFTKINIISKSLSLIVRNNTKSTKSCEHLKSFLSQNGLKVSSNLLTKYLLFENDLKDLNSIKDKELQEIVAKESQLLTQELRRLEDCIINESIVDDIDINECCLDLNCGVGGQEAMLFTKELFDVYLRFCGHNNWNCSLVANDCDTEYGGSRHSSLIVNGSNCYQLLRHEAGVHRVQRIPKTERSGRIHTSTITVAVIPIRHNEIVIKDSDLKFEAKTSQGAGGQHVNKTMSCVRITHIPTNLSVECQETRSQIQNRAIALTKLKAILNQIEFERKKAEEKSTKRLQVGIASRSDKIRTYNFPQNRITDHRINENIFDINDFMKGNCDKLLSLVIKLENQRRNQLIEQMKTALEKTIS